VVVLNYTAGRNRVWSGRAEPKVADSTV